MDACCGRMLNQMVEAIALKEMELLANFIHDTVICRFSIPMRVLSDLF